MQLKFKRLYQRTALNHYEIYSGDTTLLRGRYHLYLGGVWLLHLGPHYFNPHIWEDSWQAPKLGTEFFWAAKSICEYYQQPYERHYVDEETGKPNRSAANALPAKEGQQSNIAGGLCDL